MQGLRVDGDETAGPEAPERVAFRAEVRAFLEAHATRAREGSLWAVNLHTHADEARAEFEQQRAWQRTRFDAGFAGIAYPGEYGGRGGEAWQERVYQEEEAAFDATNGFIGSTMAMLAPTLLRHGTEEQRRTLLPRLFSAADTWCQLFSEPGAGSDLAGLACRAERDGDEFVVNGQKVWNSAAQFCDHGMLLVRTNPDVPKHRGITFLLLEMDRPGVEVRPLVQATGAAHFNEVFLHDVRVPVSQVLGEVDGGWAPARTVMANESGFIGSRNVGSHAQLRALAGRAGRSTDPVVRQRLAGQYADEQVLRWTGVRMATAARAGAPPLDPSILKLAVARNRVRSGNLAVSLAGPDALGLDDEVQRWIHAELLGRFSLSIGGGTDEVHHNNLAERALGLPREPRTDHTLPWRDVPRS